MKVSVFYSGHQFDYLYGLVTAFKNQPEVHFEIIDAIRPMEEVLPRELSNVKVLPMIDKRGRTGFSNIVNIAMYYFKLTRYLLRSESDIYHIEWLNYKAEKLEEIIFGTILSIRDKKIIHKVHDIDAGALYANYKKKYRVKLSWTRKYYFSKIHTFLVHNNFTKNAMIDLGIEADRITVIAHGINNSIPETYESKEVARRSLGLCQTTKVILFFGSILPYKSIESIISNIKSINNRSGPVKLVVAGRFKSESYEYRAYILGLLQENKDLVIDKIGHAPTEEVSKYFKAADVLCLPYRHIFQSGVTFLAMRFNLPVIARNVGGLPEDIQEGKTGYIFETDDELVDTFEKYFNSELFADITTREYYFGTIKDKYSWERISYQLINEYKKLAN